MPIELENAVFGYAGRPVVRVDQLRLHPGRCVGICGPNGAGKTTLVRGIVGLLPPMSGAVRKMECVRFGYVEQLARAASGWPMTAWDVASLPASAEQFWGRAAAARSCIRQCMVSVGVADLANKPFATLSGGQRQRVRLAGALAAKPTVLVLDEPTDGLDRASRQAVLDHLRQTMSDGVCLVVISHHGSDLTHLESTVFELQLGEPPGGPSRAVVVLENPRWSQL